MLRITDRREERPWVLGTLPIIPSAFRPALSSCSLTTSFMCCHWGSPSPISWTLTSPSGLLPVLYLVILILTWSSAAWSGVTRQKRDKQHSSPQKPISRATGRRRRSQPRWCFPKQKNNISVLSLIHNTVIDFSLDLTTKNHPDIHKWQQKKDDKLTFQNINLKTQICVHFKNCASILGWKTSRRSTIRMNDIWLWWRWTQSWIWTRPQIGRGPGYLVASEPGWGCPWRGHWLFERPPFVALGPGRLSPPNDRVACPAWSPVSVLLACDQTPLSDPLSPIPVEPETQDKTITSKHLLIIPMGVITFQYIMLELHIVSSLKPRLWCCQTPSAFLPLSLPSSQKAQRGPPSHPQTPAVALHLHRSLPHQASLLHCCLSVCLLDFWPGFVLSKKDKVEVMQWNGIHIHYQKNVIY